jgi:hypothetical protein
MNSEASFVLLSTLYNLPIRRVTDFDYIGNTRALKVTLATSNS